MCCGWIVLFYFLATVCADIEDDLPSPAVACSFSSSQSLIHCGDDFFDANLCMKCGCCIVEHDEGSSVINSTSCYVPPESENDFELSPSCSRSLKSLLGQVLLLNDGPSRPRSPVTFYVLLQRYSPHLQTSLRAFGSSAIVPILLPFSRDAKDLSTSVKKQLLDLESGAGPSFFSYATVTYPSPGIYDVQLMIESRDGLDSLSVESKVSVTRTRDILVSALLQSAVLSSEGPYHVGEESILTVVLDDIDPDIELTLDFGDDSKIARRGSLSFLFGTYSVKPGYACLLAHRYSSGGEYLAKVILSSPNYQSGIKVRLTTTVRIKCSFPRVEVTGGSISKSEAVLKKRNETLIFRIWVIQNCTDQPVVTQWSLFLVDQDERQREVIGSAGRRQTNKLDVKFDAYTLAYGLYILNITVTIPYHDPQKQLVITEAVWFEVISSRPVAIIDGPLIAGDWETVTFDSSRSYDPDVNWLSSPVLNYTWYCLTGQWNMTIVQKHVENAFRSFEGCHYPGCRCQNSLDTSNRDSFLMTWPDSDHFRQTIPEVYSIALHLHAFNNRTAYAIQSVMFFPNKSRSTLPNQVAIPIHLLDKIPDADIACLSNCLQHVDHTKPLVLFAHCRNCILGENLTYEWDFQSGNASFTLKRIDWTHDTLTGNQKASLIINAKTFENITEDESYQFFVTVTRLSGKYTKAGFSFYFAKYNTDYNFGASKDSSAIAVQQQLHMFLITLVVLTFEWV